MKPITFGGFQSLALAWLPGTDGLLFLSIAGPLSSVRAIAAALLDSNRRKYRSGIRLGGSPCNLIAYKHYKTFVIKAAKQKAHGITTRVDLVHESFTTAEPRALTLRFLVPEDWPNSPPETFFPRLRAACGIPLLPEWEDWLWKEGQTEVQWWGEHWEGDYRTRSKRTLITPIRAVGVKGYQVGTLGGTWLEVVRRHFGLTVDLVHETTGDYCQRGDPEGWRIAYRLAEVPRWQIWRGGHPQTETARDKMGQSVEHIIGHRDLDMAVRTAYVKCGIDLHINN